MKSLVNILQNFRFNLTYALKTLLILFLLLEIILCLYWLRTLYISNHYSDFLITLSNDFEDSFLVDDISKNFISEAHYNFVKTHIWYVTASVSLFFGCVCYMVKSNLDYTHSTISNNLYTISKREVTFVSGLFVAWLILKYFLIQYIPIHIDEMFDYVFYTQSNLLTRHAYIFTDGTQWYNNHILYCDISAFFSFLGFSDKWALRLPSILAELLLLGFLHNRYRNTSFKLYLVLFIGLVSSFWASIYSVEGRSYYVMGVLTVISFFASTEVINKHNNTEKMVFVLVNALGFGFSKLFLLPFLGQVVYILFHVRSFEQVKTWSKTIASVLMVVLLFYTPALLLSGSRALYTNVISSDDLGLRLYPLIFEALSVITNIDKKAYLFLGLVIVFLFYFRRRLSELSIDLILFIIAQFISCAILSWALSSYFPERTFIYFNLCFSLLLCSAMYDVFKDQTKALLLFGSLLIANCFYNYNFSWLSDNKRFVLAREHYTRVENACNKIKSMNLQQACIYEDEYSSLIFSKYYLSDTTNIFAVNSTEGVNFLISKQALELPDFEKLELEPGLEFYLYRRK